MYIFLDLLTLSHQELVLLNIHHNSISGLPPLTWSVILDTCLLLLTLLLYLL